MHPAGGRCWKILDNPSLSKQGEKMFLRPTIPETSEMPVEGTAGETAKIIAVLYVALWAQHALVSTGRKLVEPLQTGTSLASLCLKPWPLLLFLWVW